MNAPSRIMRDWSSSGKASGESRRKKREELKARFIAAVEAGAELTKTGIVAPRTYQTWRRDDEGFSRKIDTILAARRAARPKKVYVYKRPSRAKTYGRSAMERLTSDATYVKAVSLLAGRKLAPDIRESAISELVLMMLEGETPNVGKAVHAAKAEFLPHARYYEGDKFYVD